MAKKNLNSQIPSQTNVPHQQRFVRPGEAIGESTALPLNSPDKFPDGDFEMPHPFPRVNGRTRGQAERRMEFACESHTDGKKK